MTIHTMQKRYFYKLFSNSFSAIVGVITTIIIPRTIGPSQYGIFTYLTELLRPYPEFFSFSTLLSFFTKISQRPKEKKMINAYILFILITSSLFMLITVSASFFLFEEIFGDHIEKKYLYGALVFVVFLFISSVLEKIMDGCGATVDLEKFRFIQKVISFFTIVILFLTNSLDLGKVFVFFIFMTLIFISFISIYLIKNNFLTFQRNDFPNSRELKNYVFEYYSYSHPIFTTSIILISFGSLSAWIFNRFAGSIQFGYFGIATKISAVFFLLISSFTPIFMREISIAWDRKNKEKQVELINFYLRLFFAISSAVLIYLAFFSSQIIELVGGENFTEAAPTLSVLLLYPIHQTYGQLVGSLIYASAKTTLMRNIRIATSIFGFLVLFFLVAPSKFFGFGLGALGYALSSVIMQIITTNIMAYYILPYFGIEYKKLLIHQIFTIIIISIAAGFCNIFFIDFNFGNIILNKIGLLIIPGMLYLIFLLIIIHLLPSIIGMDKIQLESFKNQIKSRLFIR